MEEWSREFLQSEGSLFFQTPFAALQSAAAVIDLPFTITPNQQPLIAQALKAAGCEFTYSDIDFNGIAIAVSDGKNQLITDYAGIMPSDHAAVRFWSNGAGFVDDTIQKSPITIIDLQTLNPFAPTSGAVVISGDKTLLSEMKRYASLGIQKGHLWNDKIDQFGIEGLMSPLVRQYWDEHTESFFTALHRNQEISDYYTGELSVLKPIDILPSRYPRVYPLRLAPELFCPKESIFEALLAEGITAEVPFKPLYRYSAFESAKLAGCEEFYKAVLALPVHGVTMEEAKRIMETFKSIIDRYGIRSCTF